MSSSPERIEELNHAREKLKNMRTISEHEQLRSMNLEQRLDWMRERIRQRIGMIFVRIDGHMISGYADQFDDFLARFLMVVARDERPAVIRSEWQG